jgi:ABC-type antimicrobial peptide transport system permease subunit
MGLIIGEALLIGALGGGLGLAFSALIINALPNVPGIGPMVRGFPGFGLHWPVATLGLSVALALGLAAGFLPALGAYRARIVDMLRQA